MKFTRTFPVLLLSLGIFLASCAPTSPAQQVISGNSGDILYQETFADNTSGWDRVLNDGGIMDYDSGGYRFLIREPKVNYWSTPGKNFGDVRVEADVTRLNGPVENRVGLMCRYQGGNHYFFIISTDGYYAVGKFVGGQAILIGQESMVPSELILSDGINHLRADCVGNTLTFYVNFTQVASVQDADLATGDVGVLAGAFNEPDVDVLFQNFVVIQP
ncbi:MAG TPA: hypothetical protein VLA72_12940 [Anaerolineales bacterium]|nr:hypothetical protein [Anaerolineales bacterium]